MRSGGTTDLHQPDHPNLSYAAGMDKDPEAKPESLAPASGAAGFGQELNGILFRAHIRHQDLVQELDRLGVLIDPLTGLVTFRPSE